MRRKIQKYLSGEREGFSLIELIIVIAIMAILIGVVALVVLPYLESSRESTDRAALNEVATAFKSAASVNSKYATEVNKMTTATASASLNADLKKKIESYLEKSLAETEKGLSSKNLCLWEYFYLCAHFCLKRLREKQDLVWATLNSWRVLGCVSDLDILYWH